MNTSVLIFWVVCLCLPFLGVGIVVLVWLFKHFRNLGLMEREFDEQRKRVRQKLDSEGRRTKGRML